MKSDIDKKQLEESLVDVFSRNAYWHPVYQIVKRVMQAFGHWKDKGRGDPQKGYRIMKEKETKTE